MRAEIDGGRGRTRERSRRWRKSLALVNDRLDGAQKRQSWLGRSGRLIEPAVRPLGWDWRIGCAVIASFPAREVVVATLGVVFDAGRSEENRPPTGRELTLGHLAGERPTPVQYARRALGHGLLRPLRQCVSTLAVIRRETGHWGWSVLSFAYMTVLAYVGAFVTYQVGMLL